MHPWPFAGYFRDVMGLKGLVRFYWLVFDVPQFDVDGDGPIFAAEVAEVYVEPIRTARE
jgi:hypothetical protein